MFDANATTFRPEKRIEKNIGLFSESNITTIISKFDLSIYQPIKLSINGRPR